MSSSAPPSTIHMATVSAPTNIACIKYWGKADAHYNTPINSSVSVTLDQKDLRAVTTASASTSYACDRLWLNGTEVPNASSSKRFRACVDGAKALATDTVDAVDGATIVVTKEEWSSMHVHVSSYNTFPTAAGLASSAAGYAALVAALAELYGAEETFEGELSTIARQGSGSACRSLYGGFVAWRMGGEKRDRSDSKAEPVADERHWPEIRAVILVASDEKKDTSSTDGMSTAVATSELLRYRAASVVPGRMEAIEAAFLGRDFETFGRITMADSNQFHATCLDSYPPIFYMNDVSRAVVKMVHGYNAWAGQVRAAYTFDAGPNAVLYTLAEYQPELLALALAFFPSCTPSIGRYVNDEKAAKEALAFDLDPALLAAVEAKIGGVQNVGDVKTVYCTRSGPGPQVLDNASFAIIDPKTGLNTYKGGGQTGLNTYRGGGESS